jgi:hypothetical protein
MRNNVALLNGTLELMQMPFIASCAFDLHIFSVQKPQIKYMVTVDINENLRSPAQLHKTCVEKNVWSIQPFDTRERSPASIAANTTGSSTSTTTAAAPPFFVVYSVLFALAFLAFLVVLRQWLHDSFNYGRNLIQDFFEWISTGSVSQKR